MVVVCIWDLFVLYYSSRIFSYGHVTITTQQELRIPCIILVHIMLAHFLISIKLLITRSTLVAGEERSLVCLDCWYSDIVHISCVV